MSHSVLPPGFVMPRTHRTVAAVSYNACPATSILFISDANNAVIDMYAAGEKLAGPCGSIVGNGLSQPQGLDVDKKGDLYVANTGASNILEFKPPYTGAPAKTMSDPGQYPAGIEADCGKFIWVTNIITTAGGAGTISNYTLTGLTPVSTKADANAAREYFLTCDAKGNVFTSYSTSAGAGGVNEFTAPSYVATDLTGITVGFPGGLEYEDTFLLVDDQTGRTITQWTPPSTKGAVISLTTASDPVTFDVNVKDEDLFTADAGLTQSQEWDYPGGAFDSATTAISGSLPIGAAVYKDDNDP